MTKSVILCILDGWGYRNDGPDNAIALANTPVWDQLWTTSPHTFLEASQEDVGLPAGQMGNSEVGHMTIGAGRIFLQDLPRIDEVIEQDKLKDLPAFQDLVKSLKSSKGTCHLLGLLSPGGIHSHDRHLKALATALDSYDVPVAIHAFLDGRDTPPKSAHQFLKSLLDFIAQTSRVKLATVGGRYFGMDRDQRWERIQKAYDVMVLGEPKMRDALEYIERCYADNITDEFIPPVALPDFPGMKDGDGLLMGNFRADRVRQILTALLDSTFKGFPRQRQIKFAADVGMTEYSEALSARMTTLFPPTPAKSVLGEIISDQGLKQLRIAETEKYAHVTFFLNGGREDVFPGEDRILIPSPKVATYDLQPEMAAYEMTDRLVEAIETEKYSLIVANYANTDMVGHTGNLEATKLAVEAVDLCVGRLVEACHKTKACLILTADHGNAEMMFDAALQSPHTAHTLNPVPFLVFNGPEHTLHRGKLSDIAPTILSLLSLSTPPDMTGASLYETQHD